MYKLWYPVGAMVQISHMMALNDCIYREDAPVYLLKSTQVHFGEPVISFIFDHY